MKIYSYVVKYDTGFAPNPFGDYCTLATCKPKIRQKAQVGDWIIGTGSVENVDNDRLIYVMKVNEILSPDEYFNDDRFQYKKPDWDMEDPQNKRGDNIYYKDDHETYHQLPSYHSNRDGSEDKEALEKDIRGKNVLISQEFYYFGLDALILPKKYRYISKEGPGHKCNFKDERVQEFLAWLAKLEYEFGMIGMPSDYSEEETGCNDTKPSGKREC